MNAYGKLSYKKLNKIIAALLLVSAAVLGSAPSYALTAAGTIINNTATVNFNVDGVPASAQGSVDFTVQEIIDVSVAFTNASNIIVSSPDTDQVAIFDITNTGNGSETFSFSLDNVASPADDFDFTLPAEAAIYIEDGTTPGFQITEDTLYTGANNPVIASEASQTVYIVAQVPGGLANLAEGHLEFTAESTTAGAAGVAAGTALVGLGDTGVDAIVGTSQASSSDTAIYEVSAATVDITAEIIEVEDQFGGNILIPGAEVTYLLTVTIGGGIAENTIVTDPIPNDTTYVPETVVLDGVPLTDADDADSGNFNVTTAGAISVFLGDTLGGTVFEIEVTVVIN